MAFGGHWRDATKRIRREDMPRGVVELGVDTRGELMTAQIRDILIHRGELLSLCATPLDEY